VSPPEAGSTLLQVGVHAFARLGGRVRGGERVDPVAHRGREVGLAPADDQLLLQADGLPAAPENPRDELLRGGGAAGVGHHTVHETQSSAWAAVIGAPVSSISAARPGPIIGGSSAAWMTEGTPTRTSGRPNEAPAAATRRSQASASSKPAPRHAPFTAA